MVRCVDCGKAVAKDDDVYCHDCGEPLCKECGVSGLCSVCSEVWKTEENLEFEK